MIDIDTKSLNITINENLFSNIRLALQTIKDFSSEQFERLCALYLQFLGCNKPSITKKSHDQGIVFVGTIDNNSKLIAQNIHAPLIFFIGQAKHYTDEKVSSKEVRELAGSLYLLKHKNFALLQQPYRNLSGKIKAFTPLYAFFITLNYFSQTAKVLCNNSDIIPIDRILLSITFGLDNTYQNGEGVFIPEVLEESLGEIETIA